MPLTYRIDEMFSISHLYKLTALRFFTIAKCAEHLTALLSELLIFKEWWDARKIRVNELRIGRTKVDDDN
ncbi:MAG: hypothetical protein DLM72_06120 [Candidatus Nitrosopolaris wilkensis]|nr:MAG: hypothetical protein DLM72_06120 [Candidatus Nitrosopolaris wilkensis]